VADAFGALGEGSHLFLRYSARRDRGAGAYSRRPLTSFCTRRAVTSACRRGRFERGRQLAVGPDSVVCEYDNDDDIVSVIALALVGPVFR
jgi:hypothetical protein